MRPINTSRYLMLAGASLAALLSSAANAQPSPAGSSAASAPSAIDDIIVTAQRTSQSLQDVPIAVSAFTAETLERQQINNTSDLQLTLPNITFTKSNFTGGVFTIRGVGDLCVGVTCDSATAIHVNDLPLFGTRIFETEFFDLERIEVLRGPQGTLFGRNATAGVVNFITAKPDLKAMHAAVEGEYGNYNSVKVKGMINVPLTDTLGIRVAGTYLKRGGFTKNLYDDSHIDGRKLYSIRGSIRWQPTDDTTVDLMGYYFHENDDRLRIQKQLCQRDPTGVLGCTPGALANQTVNGNATLSSIFSSKELLTVSTAPFRAAGAGGIALANGLVGLSTGSLYGPDGYANAINPTDPRSVYTAFQPQYFADEIQASAQITHDFGAVKVKVSGLYQRDRVDSQQDYNLSIQSGGVYAAGLTTAAAYAAGAGGPLLQQITPALRALAPNGAAGPFCTSQSEETGTGVFGGHAVCGAVPLNFDRSVNANDAYTGEAIVSSQFDGKFNFLLGGIYNRIHVSENSYYVNAFGLDYAAAVLGLAGTLGAQLGGNAAFPNSYRATPFYRNNTDDYLLKSYGIYGEAYLQITDKLKLTGGIRYNNDKKTVSARTTLYSDFNGTAVLLPYGSTDFSQAVGYANLDFDPNPGNQLFDVRKVGFSEVTGRAVLDYKISDDNLVYLSYSRGYKSGGINPPLTAGLGVPESFAPEFIDSFEFGSKNTFLDGRLRLNMTAFYYKYKALQLSRIVNRTSVNDNVDADIYGLEGDAIIQPIPALAINLGFSYLHTKVSQDKFLSNPRDPSGGRGDAVIIKDITNASNCAVVPTVAGNGAGARGFVGAINGGVGLQAPVAFPTGSGLTAGTTGAFSICSALASNAATVGALFGGVQVLNAGVAVNIKGNELPQAPRYKASAGIQYTVDFADGMTLVPRADLVMTGNSYGSIFNGSEPGQTRLVNRIPSYTIINAQIQLNGKDDRFFVRGFIQNLRNSSSVTGQYVTDQSSGLYTNIFTLEPRRYGIAGGVKF